MSNRSPGSNPGFSAKNPGNVAFQGFFVFRVGLMAAWEKYDYGCLSLLVLVYYPRYYPRTSDLSLECIDGGNGIGIAGMGVSRKHGGR